MKNVILRETHFSLYLFTGWRGWTSRGLEHGLAKQPKKKANLHFGRADLISSLVDITRYKNT